MITRSSESKSGMESELLPRGLLLPLKQSRSTTRQSESSGDDDPWLLDFPPANGVNGDDIDVPTGVLLTEAVESQSFTFSCSCSCCKRVCRSLIELCDAVVVGVTADGEECADEEERDRKSTRLNSSHVD